MSDKADRTKLSLGTKMGYGVCDLGGNLFFTALGFWALKYLTDRTRTRWGRRRPYISSSSSSSGTCSARGSSSP